MRRKINKRRRREGKTDYKARLILLKSELPRIVIRKTNKYIIIQYIKSKESKDFVVVGTTSKELLKYGWPKEWKGSLKSIPAAYLTGLLVGKEILEKEGEKQKKEIEAIFDIGLTRSTKGSRVYAVLKGLIDAGIRIKYKPEILPEKERIEGMHMKKDVKKIINEIKNRIGEK